jgi:rod shape determining protein RodA
MVFGGFLLQRRAAGYQRRSIEILINPSSDPLGSQAGTLRSRKLPLARVGWRARLSAGHPNQFDFVPEQSTDFIFCTVGEVGLGRHHGHQCYVYGAAGAGVAERQSVFGRTYGCVASIIFFPSASTSA